MKQPINKDVPFITYIIHDKNMEGGRTVTVYRPTQEYYTLFELIKFRRIPATFPDIGITVISEGLEPSSSDVSIISEKIDIRGQHSRLAYRHSNGQVEPKARMSEKILNH